MLCEQNHGYKSLNFTFFSLCILENNASHLDICERGRARFQAVFSMWHTHYKHRWLTPSICHCPEYSLQIPQWSVLLAYMSCIVCSYNTSSTHDGMSSKLFASILRLNLSWITNPAEMKLPLPVLYKYLIRELVASHQQGLNTYNMDEFASKFSNSCWIVRCLQPQPVTWP